MAISIIIAFLTLKLGFFYNKEAASISGSTTWLANFYNDVSYFQLIRNVLYSGLLLGDGTLNPPLWTLKVEFLGSLLLLAFYLIKPRGNELMYVIAISVSLFFLLGRESIYYIALFSGALINTLSRIRFKWPMLIVGLYFAGYQYESSYYAGLPSFSAVDDKTLYNAIAAFMLVVCVKFGCFRRFFNSAICQFLGKTSFSAYLLHMVILGSVISYLYVDVVDSGLALFGLFMLYLVLVYVFSIAYFYWVDKRAVRLSQATLFPYGLRGKY